MCLPCQSILKINFDYSNNDWGIVLVVKLY